ADIAIYLEDIGKVPAGYTDRLMNLYDHIAVKVGNETRVQVDQKADGTPIYDYPRMVRLLSGIQPNNKGLTKLVSFIAAHRGCGLILEARRFNAPGVLNSQSYLD